MDAQSRSEGQKEAGGHRLPPRWPSLRPVRRKLPTMPAPSRRYAIAIREMALTTGLVLAYFLIRGAHQDDIPASAARTVGVIRLESALGLFHEPAWQKAFLSHPWLIEVANAIYFWGEYTAVISTGIWLSLRDIQYFRFIRNVLLISAVLGIAGYWLLPAAPPRLLAASGYDYGFVDTLHSGTQSGVHDLQPGPFVNYYAALPSFHFAWVVLAAVGVWARTESHLARGFVATLSATMFWAIVVTANHLFFDMALGVAVVAVSWLIATLLYSVAERYRCGIRCSNRAPVRAKGI